MYVQRDKFFSGASQEQQVIRSTRKKSMAQDDIMSIIDKHPEGITGNGIKTALKVNWGVTQQVERLREKGLVTKKQGETRLTWIYYPVKEREVKE